MYDHVPSSPIPKDATFHRLQFDGREKYIVFDFHSFDAPEVKALKITYDEMTRIFKTILRDRMPTDVEMVGFYRSDLFAYLMVEFASDSCKEEDSVVQMRYEQKELILTSAGKGMTKENL